jgi:hypothetical protein
MKNLSLLSLATLMLGLSSGCVLTITDDVSDDEATTDATADATDDATSDATEDATSNGDGDVDTTTTAETGTTDPTTETTTDPTAETGTETTGNPSMCGWDAGNGYYECGFEGSDPGGSPIECPEGLVEGDPCETTGLSGAGCCDANGDNWYCTQEGTVFFNSCAG